MKQNDVVYCTTCEKVISPTRSKEQDKTIINDRMVIPGLREVILRKLNTLAEMIESENDVSTLTSLMNLVAILLQILKQLETSS